MKVILLVHCWEKSKPWQKEYEEYQKMFGEYFTEFDHAFRAQRLIELDVSSLQILQDVLKAIGYSGTLEFLGYRADDGADEEEKEYASLIDQIIGHFTEDEIEPCQIEAGDCYFPVVQIIFP